MGPWSRTSLVSPRNPALEQVTSLSRNEPLSALPAIDGLQATIDKPAAEAGRARIQESYGRLPMHFEPNRGQTAKEVKFLARGPGYALFLTEDELVMSLRRGAPATGDEMPPGALGLGLRPDRKRLTRPEPAKQDAVDEGQPAGAVLRFGFVGANAKPAISGIDLLGGHSNYFLGDDPAKWRTHIPHYAECRSRTFIQALIWCSTATSNSWSTTS